MSILKLHLGHVDLHAYTCRLQNSACGHLFLSMSQTDQYNVMHIVLDLIKSARYHDLSIILDEYTEKYRHVNVCSGSYKSTVPCIYIVYIYTHNWEMSPTF